MSLLKTPSRELLQIPKYMIINIAVKKHGSNKLNVKIIDIGQISTKFTIKGENIQKMD